MAPVTPWNSAIGPKNRDPNLTPWIFVKKKADFSDVEMIDVDEGLCVQCMHVGSYDDEPATIQDMREHALAKRYVFDENGDRGHHEIYLSDPRRVSPERLKTVIRIPAKEA